MQTTFTIGDLAKEFGVTLRTLRFYEDKNLIHPRRQGLSRLYGRRERARLKLILLGKKVGFSLDKIKEMLAFYDLRDGNSAQLEMALKRFTEQIDVLKRQKSDVEQAIDELTRTMGIVSGMLGSRDTAESVSALQAAE
jgi:DNA-binding transcriptional MerR regulator